MGGEHSGSSPAAYFTKRKSFQEVSCRRATQGRGAVHLWHRVPCAYEQDIKEQLMPESSKSMFSQSARYHESKAAEYRRLFGESAPDWDLSLIDLAKKHDALAAKVAR